MSRSNKTKLIVIAGPTASGKTGLAIELAKRFDGEVISADSRQVYQGLDIGTAKVTAEEMDGIPHHLIDVAKVEEVYTAADFKRDAEKAVASITKCGKLPIIAGGTFFYVDALLGRVQVPEVKPNPELRARLEKKSTQELLAELQRKDIRRFVDVDPDNRRRIIRALEIIHELDYVPPVIPSESSYEALILGLKVDMRTHGKTLRQRLISRLDQGMVEEVKMLLKQGISHERLEELGLEYRYLSMYLRDLLSYEDMVEQLATKIRQYAKRQLTWLKRYDDIKWLSATDRKIFKTVEEFIDK